MDTQFKRLGFIGLGVMGEPICRNLATRSGLEVRAFDLNEAPLLRLAAHGVRRCASLNELVRDSDVVFLSLPSGEVVRSLAHQPGGLLERMRPGQLLVDLSTSQVSLTLDLAKAFEARGVTLVDAPVARTRAAAEAGTLSVMVGARPEVFAALRPLLTTFASDIALCGAVGSGQVLKILNNYVLFQTGHALAEARAIAKRAGIDTELLFDVLSKGSADSFALRNHGMKAMLPQAFPENAFSVEYARKDLRYALALAADHGLEAPWGHDIDRLFEAAIARGHGKAYWPVISKLYDDSSQPQERSMPRQPGPASDPGTDFAPAQVDIARRPDGGFVLRSPQPLQPYGTMAEAVDRGAGIAPDRVMLAERSGPGWRELTWREGRAAIRAIAGALLDLGASGERPVMILSDNSVDVGLLTLAAHYIGAGVVHTTSAYAQQPEGLERLRNIVRQTDPAVVYASDAARYGKALDALQRPGSAIVTSESQGRQPQWLGFDTLQAWSGDASRVSAAAAAVSLDAPARLLFTSGSTSQPKGVIHTQGMLAANAQARAQLWPFLDREPMVLLDWLPWSHGFGSSQNFTMALWHQGSFYIDDGRPLPGQIERTVENILRVRPTLFFSVPAAYQLLLPFLQKDAELARAFFGRMRVLFYAAADMPRYLWQAYEDLARQHADRPPYFTSSWGMTEVLAATYVHYPIDRAGNIGLPMPGVELKFAPVDDKLEIRVKGWGTTSGYWKQPELTAAAFDEEGYFCSGDAGKLWDPNNPAAGIAYDGRIGENFKLSSGRWVPVGELRLRAVSEGAPLVLDAVVAGHGQADASLLLFLDAAACRELVPEASGADLASLAAHPRVRERLREMLRTLAQGPGGLPRVGRAIALPDAPVPGIELSEKGNINQRAALERRAAAVDLLYAPSPTPEVISTEDNEHE